LARRFSSLPYKGLSREQFLQAFREIGIPENIPAAVYDYYGSQEAYKGFAFLPDDEYSKVLYDDPDDLDEDALALFKQLGMVLLPEYILKTTRRRTHQDSARYDFMAGLGASTSTRSTGKFLSETLILRLSFLGRASRI
jgi:hypothetical protein